jgi:hypothetical protein
MREQAELQIRGQGRSLAPDDIDFVEQAADLLAALQLWAEAQDRTDDDVQSVEAASGKMLKNIAKMHRKQTKNTRH